jgi:hypothetical protein
MTTTIWPGLQARSRGRPHGGTKAGSRLACARPAANRAAPLPSGHDVEALRTPLLKLASLPCEAEGRKWGARGRGSSGDERKKSHVGRIGNTVPAHSCHGCPRLFDSCQSHAALMRVSFRSPKWLSSVHRSIVVVLKTCHALVPGKRPTFSLVFSWRRRRQRGQFIRRRQHGRTCRVEC